MEVSMPEFENAGTIESSEESEALVTAGAACLWEVVAALSTALGHPAVEGGLPRIFEKQVEQLLSMRAVRLREIPARYQARLVTPTRTAESIVLGVPSADPRVQAVLEASFERDRPLDEQDVTLLTVAAQLGGLVLAASRAPSPQRSIRAEAATPLIGSTAAMDSLRDRVARVALTDFTVLVEGESGTGKELVARQLHELSRRRTGPFVAVNCAAVVETLLEAELFGIEDRTATGVRGRRGKFEHADGGTLFLDEVSDLALSAQAKLLRAIQDVAVERVGGTGTRRIDTRIVVATNRPLAELVEQGRFRADLYYRLSGVDIRVPPLRQRQNDITELVAHFLARHRATRDLSISDAAMDALRLYDWPGNVRELERLIERVVALAPSHQVELSDLPQRVCRRYGEVLGPSVAAGESMRAWGSRYAKLIFERCGRNKRATARMLGLSYHTLEAYLRYGSISRSSTASVPEWARGQGSSEMTKRPERA
jgi:DNA-binding NtrC family response regulator